MRAALKKLDFLAVSEINAHADGILDAATVVLPAAGWGEKDGTVTNSERRISRQRPFLRPPGEAKPDWLQIVEVARRLGHAEAFAYEKPADIFREHAALSAFENDGARAFDIGALAPMSDAAYDALEPVQWPLPSGAKVGARRLFSDGGFFHRDRKARFVALAMPRPAAALSAAFPMTLNTGRVRDQWHTMSRTGLSPRLARHRAAPFVEVHPDDAARYHLEDGGFATVASERGQVELRVVVSAEPATRLAVRADPLDRRHRRACPDRRAGPRDRRPDLRSAGFESDAGCDPPLRHRNRRASSCRAGASNCRIGSAMRAWRFRAARP